MDYLLLDQLAEPTNNLSHHLKRLLLLKPLPLYQLLQIPMLTKLSYNVQTVLRTEHILKLHDVWVVEPLQKVNLGEYCVLEVAIVGKCLQINFFNCYLLFGVPLHPFVHLAVHSLP